MWDRLVWRTETDRGTGQGNDQILKVHQELGNRMPSILTLCLFKISSYDKMFLKALKRINCVDKQYLHSAGV